MPDDPLCHALNAAPSRPNSSIRKFVSIRYVEMTIKRRRRFVTSEAGSFSKHAERDSARHAEKSHTALLMRVRLRSNAPSRPRPARPRPEDLPHLTDPPVVERSEIRLDLSQLPPSRQRSKPRSVRSETQPRLTARFSARDCRCLAVTRLGHRPSPRPESRPVPSTDSSAGPHRTGSRTCRTGSRAGLLRDAACGGPESSGRGQPLSCSTNWRKPKADSMS